jgi:outer membrane biosynthesis protein TonB
MMRLWMTSYSRPTPTTNAGVISFVVHTILIGGWVAGTLPPSSMSKESLVNRVYYIPPVEKAPVPRGSRETVRYISLVEGLGAGPGPAGLDTRQPIGPTERSPLAGNAQVDSTPAVTQAPVGEPVGDSVFTVLEVDSAVVRSQNSAAPAYPLELLEKHIEGVVLARYIVDTTGFADPASLEVVRSSHIAFVEAVKEALPYMRFSPAKIGTMKVRQLVEQPFTFRITAPAPVVARKP